MRAKCRSRVSNEENLWGSSRQELLLNVQQVRPCPCHCGRGLAIVGAVVAWACVESRASPPI